MVIVCVRICDSDMVWQIFDTNSSENAGGKTVLSERDAASTSV